MPARARTPLSQPSVGNGVSIYTTETTCSLHFMRDVSTHSMGCHEVVQAFYITQMLNRITFVLYKFILTFLSLLSLSLPYFVLIDWQFSPLCSLFPWQ